MSRIPSAMFSVRSTSSGAAHERRGEYRVPESTEALGTDFTGMSRADTIARFDAILAQKMHGIAFSPFVDGQSPGSVVSEAQIRSRLEIIAPYTKWIRCFSCIDGSQAIPRIAREFGLKTMVGVELGPDAAANEVELANGIAIAQAGHADILAVGNEILLRKDLSEDALLGYIARAKAAVPDVPVSYVDAYFLFENHPRVADACDVLLVNCYPFWEGCPAEYAMVYMQEVYGRSVRVANGKRVIVSETGWPTVGSTFGEAEPSHDNALQYFIRTFDWAATAGVELFYFASFDEAWKVGREGDVGAHWGVWDKDGVLKFR
ncbi:MAG: exo-beta-1,3-glucanase (GH17 family) [Myxococcota bacterium]